MGTRVTVVLLNWRRPENLRAVIDSVYKQTLRPDIFLWNNGAEFQDPRINWQVNSSENKMCWPRWFMASMCCSDYVCSLDDDLAFRDSLVLEDAVKFADEQASGRIVGPFGVRMLARRNYMKSEHIDLPVKDEVVDIVKGRLMLFRREMLSHVGMVVNEIKQEVPIRNDDIVISGLLAKGKAGQHRVPGLFHNRLVELSAKDCGLVMQPEHWESRNKTKDEFFRGNVLRLWGRLCRERLERATRKKSVRSANIATRQSRRTASTRDVRKSQRQQSEV
jgi:hypothetical protein